MHRGANKLENFLTQSMGSAVVVNDYNITELPPPYHTSFLPIPENIVQTLTCNIPQLYF